MFGIVKIALKRPYTFVVLAILLLIAGTLSALRMPTDIFPNIRIPVIAIAWSYSGMPPSSRTSSCMITRPAPSGIMAPVKIRMACPR